jgi:hypothetical protein
VSTRTYHVHFEQPRPGFNDDLHSECYWEMESTSYGCRIVIAGGTLRKWGIGTDDLEGALVVMAKYGLELLKTKLERDPTPEWQVISIPDNYGKPNISQKERDEILNHVAQGTPFKLIVKTRVGF